MKYGHWSEADDGTLLAMLAAGHTAASIADHIGRTQDAVTAHISLLRTRGVIDTSSRAQRPWTPEEEAEALRMWRERHSNIAIAQRLDRHQSSVSAKLQQLRGFQRGSENPTRHGYVTPEALAEREHRSKLRRPTLTAEFCGDPLPGYSALDRRG